MGKQKTSAFVSGIAGVIALALGVLALTDGRPLDSVLGFVAAGMAFTATLMIWRKRPGDK